MLADGTIDALGLCSTAPSRTGATRPPSVTRTGPSRCCTSRSRSIFERCFRSSLSFVLSPGASPRPQARHRQPRRLRRPAALYAPLHPAFWRTLPDHPPRAVSLRLAKLVGNRDAASITSLVSGAALAFAATTTVALLRANESGAPALPRSIGVYLTASRSKQTTDGCAGAAGCGSSCRRALRFRRGGLDVLTRPFAAGRPTSSSGSSCAFSARLNSTARPLTACTQPRA